MNEYKLLIGNCLEQLDRKNFSHAVDLTFLDPPFNQGKDYSFHDDNLSPEEYWNMMKEVCQKTFDVTSKGGAVYFMQREKNTEEVLRCLRETGWTLQNLIIWKKKTSAVPVSSKYGKQYQVIAYATKGEKARVFNRLRISPPLPANYKFQRENGLYVTDVWDDVRELTSGYFAGDEALRNKDGERFHKQQAPLALLLRIILSSSETGDTALDPFAGTGTTLVAAYQLNRNSIGIEIDPKNAKMIRSRLEEIRDTDNIEKYYEDYAYTENLPKIWGKLTKLISAKGKSKHQAIDNENFRIAKKSGLLKISEPQIGYALDFHSKRVKSKPFIKWAGGKTRLLPDIVKLLPPKDQIGRYFEPFLGGAAMFFYLQHPKSFLSDSNKELVELYKTVQQNVEQLIKALKVHKNERDYFYEIRSQTFANLSPIQRSARFIFLNKTCFNGLYRVNNNGGFNVPFGNYKKTNICDVEGLRASSLALQNAKITHADFGSVLSHAKPSDFIYFDPPYHPLSKTSSFTSYTIDKFNDDEQKRLASVYQELSDRGCFVMLSNSDTPLIRELYKNFHIYEIQASRAINSNPNGRGKITELLIINYYWLKNNAKK